MSEKYEKNFKPVSLVHISDLHAGSQYFIANLLSRTVEEINELRPTAVVITGDLTEMGFRQEFKTAQAFLSLLNSPNVLVTPGNHDSRNVGYLHFEEIFGPRNNTLKLPELTVVGVDSSEPDLDSGRVGRERYHWIEDSLEKTQGFKIIALHHHLLPVPGTGRERNIIFDAGDLLEVLLRCGVDLALSGHKHVPYVWRLENLLVVNAGTISSLRLRGRTKPCYNIIDLDEEHIRVYRKIPFEEKELVADLSLKDKLFCKWEKVETLIQK